MNYKLPPIIENWVQNLEDPNNPEHIKENYAMMLDQTVTIASQALKKYRAKKDHLAQTRRKSKVVS